MVLAVREAGPDLISRYRRAVDGVIKSQGRLQDSEVRDMLRTLTGVRRELMEELRGIPAVDKSWRPEQLRQLRGAIERAAETFASRYGVNIRDGIDGSWRAGTGFMATTLNAIGISGAFETALSQAQLEVAHQLTGQLIRSVSQSFRDQASRQITLGVMGAKSPFAIMQDVAGLLRTQPERGAYGPIANQSERIVRTELNRTFSIANEIRQEEVSRDVPGLRHYWLTAGDGRVRPEHAAAGARYGPPGIPKGQAFNVGGEKLRFPHDPAGSAANTIACRCVAVAYHERWFNG